MRQAQGRPSKMVNLRHNQRECLLLWSPGRLCRRVLGLAAHRFHRPGVLTCWAPRGWLPIGSIGLGVMTCWEPRGWLPIGSICLGVLTCWAPRGWLPIGSICLGVLTCWEPRGWQLPVP